MSTNCDGTRYIDCNCEAEAWDFLKRAGLHTLEIEALKDIGYFTAPASKGHPLACAGGLMRHSINVSKILLDLASHMLGERSCCRIGMLHDLVKCYCYRPADGEDGRYEYVRPATISRTRCGVGADCARLRLLPDDKGDDGDSLAHGCVRSGRQGYEGIP